MSVTKPEALYVRQQTLGPKQNFIHLVGAPESDLVAMVDPAWDVPALEAALAADGKRLGAVVLTHHHDDHINGVAELLRRHDVPVYVQATEHDFAEQVRFGGAVKTVAPQQTVKVGPLELELFRTPGHTPGSQCVLTRGALFSGDTLFVGACGRCDFRGGDPEAMFDSLHRVLGALPDDTQVYPGHDYGEVKVSSLGREKAKNPYYQLKALGDFVAWRMRPR